MFLEVQKCTLAWNSVRYAHPENVAVEANHKLQITHVNK